MGRISVELSDELEKKLRINAIYVTDYLETDIGEIEDLFDEELYIEALKTAYPGYKIKYTEDEMKEKCISKRTKRAFERQDYTFEKWKLSRVLSEWARSGDERITSEIKGRFENIFKDVNKYTK